MARDALCFYSGFFAAEGQRIDHNWVGRALSRHLRWCRLVGVDYRFLASPMGAWSKLSRYPWSWTFGTLVKFEAMRDFLGDSSKGDRFIWMDLDVYPEDHALPADLTNLGPNVLAAPKTSPSFCGWPGPADPAHLHAYCKLLWTGLHRKVYYYALTSGMFSLDRRTLSHFWSWLERRASIDDPKWWQEYTEKQEECARLSGMEPFLFGSEEGILEEWLNDETCEDSPEFVDFGFDIHGLCDDGRKHAFTHYYGQNKNLYPKY